MPIEMKKAAVPAGGLHNKEDLQIGKQRKVLILVEIEMFMCDIEIISLILFYKRILA